MANLGKDLTPFAAGAYLFHAGEGVVERAQHAGDILKRAILGSAFFQRAGRLAFKIDNVGVIVGHQYLAKVKVAVYARKQAAFGKASNGADGSQHLVPVSQELPDQLLLRIGTVLLMA